MTEEEIILEQSMEIPTVAVKVIRAKYYEITLSYLAWSLRNRQFSFLYDRYSSHKVYENLANNIIKEENKKT